MNASDRELLGTLLADANLPTAIAVTPLTGRGFDSAVYRARLADGRDVVLRRWREPREPEHARARFLADHGVPAPAFLAGNRAGSLHAFVPGALLGDLIESGRCTDAHWRAVGRAYGCVRAVTFPPRLTGEVLPDRLILRPVDPVAAMHAQIDQAMPGVRARLPEAEQHLPALHALVARAARPLREARTTLGHGDINMWNIFVDGDKATPQAMLIDWDYPRVGDPAMEVALLEKHASLFNGIGVPPAFFAGYGHGPAEPNTAIHRVVQTLAWAASDDWAEFATMPPDLSARAAQWLQTLLAYLVRLPEHLDRLSAVIDQAASGDTDEDQPPDMFRSHQARSGWERGGV